MALLARLARTTLLATPLFLFAAHPLAQPSEPAAPAWLQAALQGEELAKDKTYSGGTRVKSERLGISLKVPDGFSASFTPGGNALLLKAADRVGVLFLRSGMGTAEIAAMFTPEMDLTGMHDEAWGERTAEPKIEGSKVSAVYQGDEIYGRAQGGVGQGGQGWAIVVMAGSDAVARAAIASVADSVAWAAPQSARELEYWRGQVEGQRLQLSAGAESISADLHKGGAYSLTYRNDGSEQKVSGRWRVEIGAACGFLVLAPEGGQATAMWLAVDGKNLSLDGTSYTRTPLDGSAPAPDEPARTEPRPAEADDKAKTRKVSEDPNWKTDQKEVPKLEGDEIQFNVAYDGDKRLKTDFLGISFKMPAAVRGGSDGKTPVFLMRPADQRGLGILAMQTGLTAASGAAFLHDDLDLGDLEQGVVLKPSGAAKVEGGRVTQDFSHQTYHARAVMLIGPSGNALAVTFIGAKEDREKLNGYCDAVIKSVQFAKPQAETRREEIRKQLFGKCLHVYRYKQAGSGANSSSWETKIHWHFGSDGTYLYTYVFTGDHWVKGRDGQGNDTHTGGAWSENNKQENGKWRIEFNLTGMALVLVSEKGTEATHQIRVTDGKVYLNDEEVSVFNSDKKR